MTRATKVLLQLTVAASMVALVGGLVAAQPAPPAPMPMPAPKPGVPVELHSQPPVPAHETRPPPVRIWDIPDVDMLPDDDAGRLARYGRSIFDATYAHIGPDVADRSKRFAGNNLACKNCHLNDGFKKYGLPLIGASVDFPAYSERRGRDASIEDRLNSCMTRSMNGRPMPAGQRELQALVAYLNILSSAIKADADVIGRGAGQIPQLHRAADPGRGRQIYAAQCVACHGSEGQGVRRGITGDALGYLTPPLWGDDSFNDGAGMNRLITAANFAHSNMPNGTSWVAPTLSVDDSWDVAAFMVSQPRPQKPNLATDFPDKLEKPIDTPYGPYADGFSERQHKYGPFGPISAEVKRLTREQAPATERSVGQDEPAQSK